MFVELSGVDVDVPAATCAFVFRAQKRFIVDQLYK